MAYYTPKNKKCLPCTKIAVICLHVLLKTLSEQKAVGAKLNQIVPVKPVKHDVNIISLFMGFFQKMVVLACLQPTQNAPLITAIICNGVDKEEMDYLSQGEQKQNGARD